jgi:hypothetical protein
MKVLVVTNCATAAYTSGLRAIFPQWEVKGARLDLARKWLSEEPNPAFADFLAQAELLITGASDDRIFAGAPASTTRLVIPPFYFRGYHPDSFHLECSDRPVPSVLGSGNLHSRIAATAFLLGMTPRDTADVFNPRVYERCGYFSVFDSERDGLLERFSAHDIDLASAFDSWVRSGNFLYTYNHPRAFVFNDILLQSLAGRLIEAGTAQAARASLVSITDYLEPSMRWPVYPELAKHYGFESTLTWRTGEDTGSQSILLEDFVRRTFEILSTFPGLTADCIPGFVQCRDGLSDDFSRTSHKHRPGEVFDGLLPRVFAGAGGEDD